MQATRRKTQVSSHITEAYSYWQKQLLELRASGLTRKEYCRQNGISYDRFTYWMGKLVFQQPQAPSNRLLPVQIKPTLKKAGSGSLFSLTLKNGCILQIHNEEALSLILERMA